MLTPQPPQNQKPQHGTNTRLAHLKQFQSHSRNTVRAYPSRLGASLSSYPVAAHQEGSVNSEPSLLSQQQSLSLKKALPGPNCQLGTLLNRTYGKGSAKTLWGDEQFLLSVLFLLEGARTLMGNPTALGEPVSVKTMNRALDTALHDVALSRMQTIKQARWWGED